VVETNTFGAHRFKLGPHGFDNQVRKINREGARIAREAANGRALVAGSIGPLGKPLEPFGNIVFADARAAYAEQAEGLAEGGVDLFLIETMPSLDQARAAVTAVRAVSELPFAVSMTFNEEGTTFYGDKPEDIVRTLEEWGAAVVGANCSQGPQPMLETVQRMAAVVTRARVSAMPNAGAPALVDGRYVYLCTPEYMASYVRRFLAAGVTLVGIDSVNIDDAHSGGERPAHSILLGAGVPVLEHLTGLARVPDRGARLHAVPARVREFGTFPVRAYAVVPH